MLRPSSCNIRTIFRSTSSKSTSKRYCIAGRAH
ncbi:MAG: zinc-finger domain-containing protein [Acidimicrobiaceae bacterium]|nr:zinc-finger domain-containing protein [Acidimicrobiaceae bacterium]MYB86338.1 zinc-finger domain-containing protein [Acidimicrobiaceae bacterium]